MTPKSIETVQDESKESVPAFPPIPIGTRGSENDQTAQNESKESVPAFPPILIGAYDNENYQTVEVLVDDRERPSGVVTELEKAGRAIVKIEHLSVGDYCVDRAVLIERKTATDFAQSLMDGRLFSQAGRMSSSPLRPAYITRERARNGAALACHVRRCKALW